MPRRRSIQKAGGEYDVVCNVCGCKCGTTLDDYLSDWAKWVSDPRSKSTLASINTRWMLFHQCMYKGKLPLRLGEAHHTAQFEVLNPEVLPEPLKPELYYTKTQDGKNLVTLYQQDKSSYTHSFCAQNKSHPTFKTWAAMIKTLSRDAYDGGAFDTKEFLFSAIQRVRPHAKLETPSTPEYDAGYEGFPKDFTPEECERLKQILSPGAGGGSVFETADAKYLHPSLQKTLPPGAKVFLRIEGFSASDASSLVSFNPGIRVPKGKVLNPRTGRLIDASGKLAKELGLVSPKKARMTPQRKPDFKNKVVVFTGFRDARLKTMIESQGGQVKETFTNPVDLVIAKDPTVMTDKIAKARAFGLPILAYSDYK